MMEKKGITSESFEELREIYESVKNNPEFTQFPEYDEYKSNMFDPHLQSIQDKFSFVIRLMPSVYNPLHSLVSKNFYCLADQTGRFFFDSMTTFNNPAKRDWKFCPVSDLWIKLINSPNKYCHDDVRDRAKLIPIQRAVFAYVLIVDYPQNPMLNGKMLPMRLPPEITKLIERMKNPSIEELRLGTIPIQPFDFINGKNICCSIEGYMPDGKTLMGKWTVQEEQQTSIAMLPLGQNSAMVPINTVSHIINYFKELQTSDLYDLFGYKEPTLDIKRRMKQYMQMLVADLPDLLKVVNCYFPEINE